MAANKLSDATCREAMKAYADAGNNLAQSAEALGIARTTLEHRIRVARSRSITEHEPLSEDITLPDFPDDDIPIEEIIDEDCSSSPPSGTSRGR